ncbi:MULTISPECIES: dihydrofolate reductase family protein [unclassified Rathayibacter]|uniref:dihydrofolate reductase family protein n=1 Tax=unclassified Rathayibacter TaxID=2609250 RepID=UPI0006F68A1A|nr:MULTISPECIES: dihydrofolate reductase family protein [unclassified Rathayibacter]KQQ05990.1 deaminase [Rathayibacter sp. Leaf294]KQS13847.1 deaminase [Rathayibacter sp. Leaf185]
MGLVHIDLFSTVDGVGQAPGGPEEDLEGGFAFGGWQAPLVDETVGEQVLDGMQGMDALMLGRRTFDLFSSYWPEQSGPIAELFNRIPKYVASRGTASLRWSGSAQLGPDLPSAVAEVRERHEKIHVIGSLDLVQTLLSERLFDRLTLWVHPILLGDGKKVFAQGAVPSNLRLLEPVVTSPRGVVRLRYERLDGTPAVGVVEA